jgi:endogenous inhibitor of DNA gyrase (YacG/DUF329 family)
MNVTTVCPTCGTAVSLSARNPHRPFCSERCQLLDLGAWMIGDRRIPGAELAEVEEEALTFESNSNDLETRH